MVLRWWSDLASAINSSDSLIQITLIEVSYRIIFKSKKCTKQNLINTNLKWGLIKIRSLISKAALVNELITNNQICILCLNETWLKPDEY